MEKPSFDPGLTQKYTGELRRAINKDGRFNVVRRGTNWHDVHPYLYLIHSSWQTFLFITLGSFFVVNLIFATIYIVLGVENLHGANAPHLYERVLNAFFFSAQTLTTVGFGSIYPVGIPTNFVATVEVFAGLMSFAVATGLLVGRVSRPSARIGFSETMVMTPYQDQTALMFRVANRRSNSLMELSAQVLLMTVEDCGGRLERRFVLLTLERPSVLFFPLTWTIVHPIDQQSPLYGKTAEDLEHLRVEFLILIKGTDDTFGQTVHQRYSYRHDEVVWNAKFAPAFDVTAEGNLELQMDRLSELVEVGLGQLPQRQKSPQSVN